MPTISTFDFYVLGDNEQFALVFFEDGSAQQVDLLGSHGIVPIATAGTFSLDVFNPPAVVQAGINNTVVACIVSPQTNASDPDDGYFIWDGVSLFQAGTVSPATEVLDGGHDYSSPPTVNLFGGAGTGAGAVASVSLGSVSLVRVTAAGSGYLPTDSAILVFSGGGQGTSAYGTGNTADGVLTAITIVNGGSGFTGVPTVVITPVSGGGGAVANVTGISGGIITGIQVTSGGSGYNGGVTISTTGGGGGGLVAEGVIEDGVVVSVSMVSNGTGYSSQPAIRYVSTSGSGAAGVAVMLNGSISGVRFDFPSQGGSGYQTPPIVQFVGGGGPAAASITLMPFGIKGTAIESYVSRVWIADGNRILFTAPGSIVDFGNGGGAFQDNDSFQRFTYKRLKQSNGFLYLLSDSSVNYISGVDTSGTPPVTTFTNLNIDPQIGCQWPAAVTVFSRSIIFANTKGVFAIVGGAVQKISVPLDRMLDELNGIGLPFDVTVHGYPPSMAVTQIFSTDVLLFLIPVFNFFTKTTENLFCMWTGKRWFTASQSASIYFVNTFQANSTISAYGTDGTSLFPLFRRPSTLLKVLQSKLWLHPTIVTQKKAWGIYAIFECYDNTTLEFTVDTETGVFNVTQGTFTHAGSVGDPMIAWDRSAASAPAGQVIGFTMTSHSPNFALLQAILVAQDYSLRT